MNDPRIAPSDQPTTVIVPHVPDTEALVHWPLTELHEVQAASVRPADLQGEGVDPGSRVGFALCYARLGWRVMPAHGITPEGTCTCGQATWCKPGKHPRIGNWRELATVNEKTIRAWWAQWPDANVGIAPGKSLLVLDVDGQKGIDSLAGRPLPLTPTVRTGRGQHHYLRAPKDIELANRSVAPGLHIKVYGGYVIAPPSVHASGAVYQWEVRPEAADLAPCPEWLLDLLSVRPATPPSSSPKPESTARQIIPEGERNCALTCYAGKLRCAGADWPEIESALLVHNARRCSPPLEEAEVIAIARSASGWPPGPVRIDNRVVNAPLPDGPKLIAALLAAHCGNISEEQLLAATGVTRSTVRKWCRQIGDLEAVLNQRPSRRFVLIPRHLLVDPNLSTQAKVTALDLARYMNDGRAQVGLETLAGRRGVCRGAVAEHLKQLGARGYLRTIRSAYQADLGRRAGANCYEWLEGAHSEQGTTGPCGTGSGGAKRT